MNFKDKIQNPSQNQRFMDENYFNWGASVIKGEDGLYHMFYSRWEKKYTFFGWLTCSEIAHAVSANKEGPFEYKNTLTELSQQDWARKMVHNPTIIKHEDKYYLYYIGTTYGDDKPMTPDDFGGEHDVIKHEARYNQKIGVAYTTDLNEPFVPSTLNPILDKRENEWDCTFVCNPSIYVEENNCIKMIYKAKLKDDEVLILGACEAKNPEGPFERKGPSPIFEYDIEDPYIWKENEVYYMLAKDMTGAIVNKYDGILFESKDGFNFKISENKLAWDHNLEFLDKEGEIPLFVERPQLLIEDGKPVCLYNAISNNRSNSYNLARLLKS